MTMELLNRSAVIIKPLRPYLEWAKGDGTEELAELVFENLRREPHVYLLPEYEDPKSQQEVLEESWPVLFEAMLAGWVTDEAFWPKNRTPRMFQGWFEIQISSMILDLDSDTPLELI
jgi:hypothetical protein